MAVSKIQPVQTGTITAVVEAWLDDHIDQASTVAVDDTLTIEHAAAEAKAAGNLILAQSTQPNVTANKIWLPGVSADETEIPTYAEFEEVSDTASGVKNSIAEEFDDTVAYTVGQYVMYENQLYRFTSAHAAGDWDSDEVVAVMLANEIGTGGGGSGGNVTDALKAALLQLAEKVAYIDNGGQSVYQDLYDALYSNVALVSISATIDLAGHTVTAGDNLSTLRPYITVTATYDDSSTRQISNYTLSGTLVIGTNTVTISYDGMTDTVSVTAEAPSEIPDGYTEISSLYYAGSSSVYLDTGVMSGDIDYAEYSIMPTNLHYLKAGDVLVASGHKFPFLTGDNTNGERSRIGFNNRGNSDSAVTAGSYVFAWNFNERHTLKGFIDGKVYVDGNELFTVPAGSSASSELRIFSDPDNSRYFIGRLYWMKFYKNGVVYRNYVPVKNSNDVPGLYETVTGTFLYDTTDSGYIREGGD